MSSRAPHSAPTPIAPASYAPVVAVATRSGSPGARGLSVRRRILRYSARLFAVAAYGAALFIAYQLISPVLPERGGTASPAATASEPIPRPASAPARVPEWAWAMHRWHSTPAAERGARPQGAPQRLPAWYWDWREWRLSVAN
jgi:hypothetical protein